MMMGQNAAMGMFGVQPQTMPMGMAYGGQPMMQQPMMQQPMMQQPMMQQPMMQ